MSTLTRRKFLTKTATGLAAAGLGSTLSSRAWAQPVGANGDIRLGIVGLGIKGSHHIKILREIKGVRVVALCDVDQVYLDRASKEFKQAGQAVKTYRDYRILLEDKDIDAVIIATPNHWHTLQALWACQAGKDIYLEKPVCHDIWEGLRLLEMEKKYGRIIQGGTQNRSNAEFKEGLKYLRSGALGKVKWIHGIDWKYRRSMGRRRGPQRVPATVDYDLYRGPAAMKPLYRSRLHYDWHWFWDTGNGDMGNIAAHIVDNIRHIMGDDRQPDKVMSLGGRFVYDDDGETPNVHMACFDYGDIPAYAEIRTIPYKPGGDYMDNLRGTRQSEIVQCEDGYIAFGYTTSAYSNDGKKIKAWSGQGGVKPHTENFLEAVRNQDASLLNCPMKVAVEAGELFHMANLSYRSGLPTSTGGILDAIGNYPHAGEALGSIERNLKRHAIDLAKEQLTLGSWLSLEDGGRSLKVHNPESDLIAQALFQKRQYRKPYVVPEKI